MPLSQIFFDRDLNTSAKRKPKSMTADTPGAAALSPPLTAPKRPPSRPPSKAPFAMALPKPVMGTVTPEDANSLIASKTPARSARLSSSMNVTRIRADDISVLLMQQLPQRAQSAPHRKHLQISEKNAHITLPGHRFATLGVYMPAPLLTQHFKPKYS